MKNDTNKQLEAVFHSYVITPLERSLDLQITDLCKRLIGERVESDDDKKNKSLKDQLIGSLGTAKNDINEEMEKQTREAVKELNESIQDSIYNLEETCNSLKDSMDSAGEEQNSRFAELSGKADQLENAISGIKTELQSCIECVSMVQSKCDMLGASIEDAKTEQVGSIRELSEKTENRSNTLKASIEDAKNEQTKTILELSEKTEKQAAGVMAASDTTYKQISSHLEAWKNETVASIQGNGVELREAYQNSMEQMRFIIDTLQTTNEKSDTIAIQNETEYNKLHEQMEAAQKESCQRIDQLTEIYEKERALMKRMMHISWALTGTSLGVLILLLLYLIL